MSQLMSSSTGPQIRVEMKTETNLPAARADANQLEMALLNLSVNARDAMPDGGVLRIMTTAAAVGPGHRTGLPPGAYVCLTVTDSGIGMDQETLARAAEPFFSTKGVGKGTGLGLSMVDGLARQLGGAVTTLQSEPGAGTQVELWLPAHDGEGDVIDIEIRETDRTGEAGLVLLVDDEDTVRITMADMPVELGYDVVEVASADEALARIRSGLSPAIVVTDHLMPGMTGTDLAGVLSKERLDIRTLIVSGYAEAKGIAPELAKLTKPFRSDELSASLASLRV
jgi:CheY-like chemotaxis protein